MNIHFIPQRTLQHESEFEAMIDHILANGPIKTVLEIGTFEGGTAYAFAQIAERVICVDRKFGSEKYPVPVYREFPEKDKVFEVAGRSQDIETIMGVAEIVNSPSDNVLDQIHVNPIVDLLFIDGGHHYQEACVDFWIYSQFVRDGGWIAFHDAINPAWTVKNFWADLKGRKGTESWEFVLQRQIPEKKKSIWDTTQGIGLMRWRRDV